MLLVGKNPILLGQIGATTVHQVDAGQAILLGDFLGAHVFFHSRGREVRRENQGKSLSLD